MKYVNRYALILLLLFIVYYVVNFMNLVNFNDVEPSGEMIDGFKTLKVKIEYLQHLVDSKQNDIDNLKEAFSSNVKYYNNLVEKQKLILEKLKSNLNGMQLSGDHQQRYNNHEQQQERNEEAIEIDEAMKVLNQHSNSLKNLSLLQARYLDTATATRPRRRQSSSSPSHLLSSSDLILMDTVIMDVNFPHLGNFLKHLNGSTSSSSLMASLQPKFKLSKNRYATIAIGIPTIKREKTSYLLETLKSLFDAMNELEKLEALVIVIIPEIEDQSFVQNTIESLTKAFKAEMDSGLLDVIVPPTEFYPDFSHTLPDPVFNDSAERVKWRTKQNYDFAYLMAYAQKRGRYYLQLEDDVISKNGFFSTMKMFIQKQKNNTWMIVEFSQLGFIGKLFKSDELSLFINFFLMFANDKPVDWLYDIALNVKTCNPEKGADHCERSKGKLKIKYKPSLFQHVGTKSSLKGKTQKLKDKDFGKQTIVSHKNPPARVSTSLKTYMKYTLDSAYMGLNYFWSMAPSANDYILFEFKEPTYISKYYVKSGNPEHPDDKLYNATLHIKTLKPVDESRLPRDYIPTSDDFYIIDRFSNELGTVNGKIEPSLVGQITQIRIHIPSSSETWVIISEIDFTSASPPPPTKSKPPRA